MRVNQFNHRHGTEQEKNNSGNITEMMKQLIINRYVFMKRDVNRPAKHTRKQGRCCFIQLQCMLKNDCKVTDKENDDD